MSGKELSRKLERKGAFQAGLPSFGDNAGLHHEHDFTSIDEEILAWFKIPLLGEAETAARLGN